MARREDQSVPVRITTAATSHHADIAARQKRYVISMSIRTLCFIGAVAVGPGWLRWVLVAGALLLPYVAVVMANPETRKNDGIDLLGPKATRELPPSATRP